MANRDRKKRGVVLAVKRFEKTDGALSYIAQISKDEYIMQYVDRISMIIRYDGIHVAILFNTGSEQVARTLTNVYGRAKVYHV